ncbi:hypothetical protein QBC46DRAFT_397384 [Diplogelasinospora grovesii]|uniref:Tyrosinase copper-binding domain-containing protein n=1 Tax=Diplogelasinospora grovesii TaxID=303347 RepID=A0AAN6N0Z2_9PEZI|nr:hypothetical protein QBC46DRAFT_397384 [Diplogelasinospora grovesii]
MALQAVRDALTVWRWREPHYTVVADSESGSERNAADLDNGNEDKALAQEPISSLRQHLLSAYVLIATAVSLGFILYATLPLPDLLQTQQRSPCKEVSVRREWRSLNATERADFVDAMYCLASTPSSWADNRTIYDDFAILHGGIGSWCHRSASFLPWHRYTLHVFENILKDKCGFRGAIPYWDWSLDWMDLANSSIWDAESGFGGDGNAAGNVTVGGGRCVTDGPFTGLRPIIYNHTYTTHCLSRGFRFNEPIHTTKGKVPGWAYSPEAIGEILRRESYKEFVKGVENQLHNTMHQAVNGDFKAMTAANDPLFYVHHTSLDRMWWKWQQENPKERLWVYEGKHMYNSTDENGASLDDPLLYGGFAEDVTVRRVMDTEGGFLCYRY